MKMAKRKAYPLYFRPYGATVKDLGRCPVKVAHTSKVNVGFFPLKVIHCERRRTVKGRKNPVYEGCKFQWATTPLKEIPRTMLNTDSRDNWTDDPKKWMSGNYPVFQWECKDKISVNNKR